MTAEKKYTLAIIAWFTFVFAFTTFIMPVMEWSSNKIDTSQIIINLLLSATLCIVVLYFGVKQIKKDKNTNEKVG